MKLSEVVVRDLASELSSAINLISAVRLKLEVLISVASGERKESLLTLLEMYASVEEVSKSFLSEILKEAGMKMVEVDKDAGEYIR